VNEKLLKFWQKKETQFFIDCCRILLVILCVILIYMFIKNIEVVKALAFDPCKICMNKTGCDCMCMGQADYDRNYSHLNLSLWGDISDG